MTTIALNIVKQVSPESSRPYRVIETYLTSEGPRSRICSGVFTTQESAQAWIEQLRRGEW
jgi:hypothetical protein